jgi:integrase
MKDIVKVNKEIKHQELIDELINSVGLVFNRLDVSEVTRKDYLYRIPLFIQFLQSNGFSSDTYLHYKRYLKGRSDIGIATKNKYLIASKIFLNELTREGKVPDITKNVKCFKDSRKHKKFGLADDEIARIVDHLKSLQPNEETTRLKALFALLYLQGLRQVEITRLDLSDVDLKRNIIFVQGKGRDNKEKVYLHPLTTKMLKDYIKVNGIKSGSLFISYSDRCKGERIQARTIKNIFKGLFKDLNIDNTTHGFRHSFTTRLIKAFNGDLTKVKKHTRHKQVETVMVYNDDLEVQADLPKYYNAFQLVI